MFDYFFALFVDYFAIAYPNATNNSPKPTANNVFIMVSKGFDVARICLSDPQNLSAH